MRPPYSLRRVRYTCPSHWTTGTSRHWERQSFELSARATRPILSESQFAERIQKSKNPVLVYGPEIERAGGWDAGIKFAERLKAPVYISPLSDRASFPQTHPQFRGMARFAIGPLSKKLRGHDLIIVIGAQVFRYYPFVGGEYLPEGAELLQVTNDPYDAGAAIVGDSLLSDAKLALEAFIDAVPVVKSRPAPAPLHIEQKLPSPPNNPLTALEAFAALSELRPADAIVVNETASNFGDFLQNWPIVKPDSYYTFASGGLGWGSPAAVGVALAQKKVAAGGRLWLLLETELFNIRCKTCTPQPN
jgi:benzoylformate decarboxylase